MRYAILVLVTVLVTSFIWTAVAISLIDPEARDRTPTMEESYQRCVAAGGTFKYIGIEDAHSLECSIDSE